MKPKRKGTLFVLSISENSVKIAKCLIHNAKREFLNLEAEPLPSHIDDKNLAEKLKLLLVKLKFNHNTLILCLPRYQATCRYLKVPTSSAAEIERMVSLQAARYLPYPANELITGFQTIAIDKENYTHINLVIVHRNIIERYLAIFKELNIQNFSIVLSSYGLTNLYEFIKPQDLASVMVIDIDSSEAESAIINNQRLAFSRYFKINRDQPGWENEFVDEVDKTHDAYLKEIAPEAPAKIIILGEETKLQALSTSLSRKLNVPAEVLSFVKKIGLADDLANKVLNSGSSFSLLLGLGLKDMPASCLLLTEEAKARFKSIAKYKERLGIILSVAGIIILWAVIIAKNLDNKARYLGQLKSELSRISQQAEPLEQTEKRINLWDNSLQKRVSGLDVLFELHQILPPDIALLNLSYEENNQVVLHGQAPDLNSVFVLVAKLQDSSVFRKFGVKTRYATSKKTQAGEIVDFEIVCSKK